MPNTPIVQYPSKFVSGFKLAWDTNTSLDVYGGTCRDSTDANMIQAEFVTLNAAVNGANGLDSGSLANSTRYHVFAIGDSTKYKAGASLLSASTTPSLPLGYDMYRLIGVVFTDGSAHFLPFSQSGEDRNRFMWYDTPISVLSAGAATTFTGINLTTALPLLELSHVYLQAAITPNAAGNRVYFARNGSTATDGSATVSGDVAAVESWGEVSVPTEDTATILYKVDSASDAVDVFVKGYLHEL